MAPGGVKGRAKKTALAVPPAGVTTRGRKNLQTTEVARDGPALKSLAHCYNHTAPVHTGKSS